jgi:hypothetical protein
MGNVAGAGRKGDLSVLLKRLLSDESFCHLKMCIVLLWQSKYVLLFLMVPFVVFASYHVIFTVHDYLASSSISENGKKQPALPVQFESLYSGMKAIQPFVLSIVAWFELAAIPYVLIQWIHGNASFTLMMMAVQTTRNLYDTNARTRLAFKQLRTFTDKLILKTKVIPLRNAYLNCVRLIEKCAPQ